MNLRRVSHLLLIAMILILTACNLRQDEIGDITPQIPAEEYNADGVSIPGGKTDVSLIVLYTSDEHGWMDGQEEGQDYGDSAEAGFRHLVRAPFRRHVEKGPPDGIAQDRSRQEERYEQCLDKEEEFAH